MTYRHRPPSLLLIFILSPFLLLSFLTTLSRRSTAVAQCLPDQSSALLRLKKDFSTINSTTKLDSWKSGTDCCDDWEGVTCNPRSRGRITALDLSNRSISGTVGMSLFNLTSLTSLNLAYNLFNQSFPSSGFEKLANLTHLNLSKAGFYGQIPSGISRLTKLVSLDLSTFFLEERESTSLNLHDRNLRTLIANLSCNVCGADKATCARATTRGAQRPRACSAARHRARRAHLLPTSPAFLLPLLFTVFFPLLYALPLLIASNHRRPPRRRPRPFPLLLCFSFQSPNAVVAPPVFASSRLRSSHLLFPLHLRLLPRPSSPPPFPLPLFGIVRHHSRRLPLLPFLCFCHHPSTTETSPALLPPLLVAVIVSSFHRRRPPFFLSSLPSFSTNHAAAVCLPPLCLRHCSPSASIADHPASVTIPSPALLPPLLVVVIVSSFHRRRPPFFLSGLPSFSTNHVAAVCLPPLRLRHCSPSASANDHCPTRFLPPFIAHHRSRRRSPFSLSGLRPAPPPSPISLQATVIFSPRSLLSCWVGDGFGKRRRVGCGLLDHGSVVAWPNGSSNWDVG